MKPFIAMSVCALGAGLSQAGTVTMHLLETGAGRNVKIRFFDGAQQTRAVDVFAGELRHAITGGTGRDAILNGEHVTFCADVHETTTRVPGSAYEVVNIETLPVALSPTEAIGLAKADAIKVAYGDAAARLARGESMSHDYAAAFQLMLWEIVTDFDVDAGVASLDLGAGSLRFSRTNGQALSTALVNEFNALKDRIAAGENLFEHLRGLASRGFQDQIVMIPAPGALALAGLGGLAFARKRRR